MNEQGRPGQAALSLSDTILAKLAVLLLLSDDRHTHHVGRYVQDALSTASSATWLRRAEAYEDAAPRPADFTGRATAQELEERRQRCLATAGACRAHAALLADQGGEPISADVRELLGVAP